MTFSIYKNYLETISLDHIDVKTFHHGMGMEIIERKQDDNFDYNLVWMETPEMFLSDNDADNKTGRRKGAIVVLDKFDSGDYAMRDAKLNSTEVIALDLIARMIYDRKQGVLKYLDVNSFSLNAVSSLFNDYETGWRIEFELLDNVEVCLDINKFTSLAP